MPDDLAAKLRAADEVTIYEAIDRACISWPIKDRAGLLEAFNRVLGMLGVPDADGAVCDSGDVGDYENR